MGRHDCFCSGGRVGCSFLHVQGCVNAGDTPAREDGLAVASPYSKSQAEKQRPAYERPM